MITHQMVNATDKAFEFTAEASSLGLKPGEWPSTIPTDMGNGQPWIRGDVFRDEYGGEILWVSYRQCLGCISLVVLND